MSSNTELWTVINLMKDRIDDQWFKDFITDINRFEKVKESIEQLFNTTYVKDEEWWDEYYETALYNTDNNIRQIYLQALFTCNKDADVPFYSESKNHDRKFGKVFNSTSEIVADGYPYGITKTFFTQFFINKKGVKPSAIVALLKNFKFDNSDLKFMMSYATPAVFKAISQELSTTFVDFFDNVLPANRDGINYEDVDKLLPFPYSTIEYLHKHHAEQLNYATVPVLGQKQLADFVERNENDEVKMNLVTKNRLMPNTAQEKEFAYQNGCVIDSILMYKGYIADEIASTQFSELLNNPSDSKQIVLTIQTLAFNEISADTKIKLLETMFIPENFEKLKKGLSALQMKGLIEKLFTFQPHPLLISDNTFKSMLSYIVKTSNIATLEDIMNITKDDANKNKIFEKVAREELKKFLKKPAQMSEAVIFFAIKGYYNNCTNISEIIENNNHQVNLALISGINPEYKTFITNKINSMSQLNPDTRKTYEDLVSVATICNENMYPTSKSGANNQKLTFTIIDFLYKYQKDLLKRTDDKVVTDCTVRLYGNTNFQLQCKLDKNKELLLHSGIMKYISKKNSVLETANKVLSKSSVNDKCL